VLDEVAGRGAGVGDGDGRHLVGGERASLVRADNGGAA